jgi:hypothetical protein
MKVLALIATLAALGLPAAAVGATPSHAASASCKAQLRLVGTTNFVHLYRTMGGCVARMSRLTVAQRQALLRAEKTCRTAQLANATAFEATWGTNKNKENAFGKCVSASASA